MEELAVTRIWQFTWLLRGDFDDSLESITEESRETREERSNVQNGAQPKQERCRRSGVSLSRAMLKKEVDDANRHK